jgi:DNA polymerase III subunit delta'
MTSGIDRAKTIGIVLRPLLSKALSRDQLDPAAAAKEAAAAFDADALEGDLFDGFGIEIPFGLLDAGVEGGGGVVVVHGNGLLGDDGAGIDALIDEMDGAAGDFDAVVEGLFPGFEAGERGEQGGMNIDDAVGEGAEEFAFEDAHEAGEDDEVDLRVLENGDESLFGFFIKLGAEFSGRDEDGFEAVALREGKDAGPLDVRGDDDNFHGGTGARAVTREGIEVRTFAGAKDPESCFPHQRHGLCVARVGGGEKEEKLGLSFRKNSRHQSGLSGGWSCGIVRAMSFGAFPEQQPVVELLQKSLRQGRLAHGYLFSGDDMREMEGLARTLAKTLNCQNPPARSPNGQALDSCDGCLNCRRIESGNHPDVQWVRPESKIRIITIDQIRDVIQTISLKPTEAEYKIAVVVGADRMNVQAANAFLKTLEEPPARSIIVLLTCAFEQVLETIRSRCLRLHFAGEPGAKLDSSAQQWIESIASAAVAPQKSLLSRYKLLSLITGRLAEVRQAAETQLEANSPLTKYPDVERDTRERWEAELNAAIEAEYRGKRAELLLLLQWWMRDVWLSTMKMEDSALAVPQLKKATEQVAARLSPGDASENLRQLERLQRQLTTNVQESLALEIGLLKLRL